MINKAILIGNLGKDPEIRTLDGGTKVARFSVATSESYKDKAGEWQTVTEWHDIVAWRELADRVETQLKKGGRVYLEGKITHRKYQDKEGNDKYVTEIVANMFRSLEKREKTDNFPSEQQAPPEKSGNTGYGPEDDLPF